MSRANDDIKKYRLGQKEHRTHHEMQKRARQTQEKYVRFGRGEAISYESSIRVRTSLQKTVIILKISCFELLKCKVELPLNQFEAKLSVKDARLEQEQIDDQNRFCTFALKMSANGKIYNALTSNAFEQYICDWQGPGYEFYVLQSKSLNEQFEPFDC